MSRCVAAACVVSCQSQKVFVCFRKRSFPQVLFVIHALVYKIKFLKDVQDILRYIKMAIVKNNNKNDSPKPNKIFQGMLLNMLKQGFLLFRVYLDLFIDFVFSFVWEDGKKTIPDLEKRHNILTESAVILAAKIRNKELKSADLVQICIERIKIVNPVLNAVTDERYKAALKDAQEVDKLIEDGLSQEFFDKKPFFGVPFTAKESHGVKGMLQTLGLLSRAHTRAPEDAECVRLLREAGAIPIAITNVPEINKWQETRNMLFGCTNNPYHTGRTTGGSSGGEAALMAAIATPIALCSDIGGSTRMPAFYCGLYAHNPTAGYTSLKGSVLRSGKEPTMASIGFLSRHLDDLAPLTKVVAGDKAHQLRLDRQIDFKDIEYHFTETAQDLRVSPICKDLRKAMNKVVTALGKAATSGGSVPKPYSHAGFRHMFVLWRHAMTREADSFPRLLTNNTGVARAVPELIKKIFGQSEYTLAAIMKLFDEQILPQVDPEWADKLTEQMTKDLTTLLGDRGVLLFPSAPMPAPYHYSLLLRPFNFAYFGIFNVLKFPTTQVPLGVNSAGLPLGVQVVAAAGHDALCLAAARHLQSLCAEFVPPCRIMH